MDEKGRLEEELEIAGLVEKYEALRPEVENPKTKTQENMAEYRALNDQMAALRTAYKEKYLPPARGPQDATASPEAVAATVTDGDDS